MIWTTFLLLLVFALLLSSVLAWGFGWRHPARADAVGTAALFLFLILLFSMWAGAAWIPPWGPLVFGTPWLELLLIGLLVSLLVLAIGTPARRPHTLHEAAEEAREEAAVGTAFGVFFWALLAFFLVAIVAGYLV